MTNLPRLLPFPNGKNTALVIIDMQEGFTQELGEIGSVDLGRVLPEILRLRDAANTAGIPVIHIITVYRKNGVDEHPFPHSAPALTRSLHENSSGSDIIPELKPIEGEYIVIKKKYSGFYQTDLELLLRALHVECVVVAGIATNFCVRSTVHDAYFREFLPIVPRECVASFTTEEHEQSLKDISNGFGIVTGIQNVLEIFSDNRFDIQE